MNKTAIGKTIEKAVEKIIEKITLFDVNISNDTYNGNNALVLSGCKLSLLENIKYSELDENNYLYLNNNDYGCGGINVELNFDNNYKNPYFEFYINCITIRVDNKIFVKKNVYTSHKSYTKINKNGKLSIGVGYFFTSEEEYEIIKECSSFVIEGFIAFNKKNNVYGFMCEVKKERNLWNLSEGNTYKIYKKAKINNLLH